MDQLKTNLATFTLPDGSGGIGLSDEVLKAISEVHNTMRNPALVD
jgi:hypothetical protein